MRLLILPPAQVFPCAHAHVVKRVVGLYGDDSIKPFRGTRSRLCAQVSLCSLDRTMWAS